MQEEDLNHEQFLATRKHSLNRTTLFQAPQPTGARAHGGSLNN